MWAGKEAQRREASVPGQKNHHVTEKLTLAVNVLGGENGPWVGGFLITGMCEGFVSEETHVPM